MTRSRRGAPATLALTCVLAAPMMGATPSVAQTETAKVELGPVSATVTRSTKSATGIFVFVVNSQTSAFKLSVLGYAPREIVAPAQRIRVARPHDKWLRYRTVRSLLDPQSETLIELEGRPRLRRAVAEALRQHGSVRFQPTVVLRDDTTRETVRARLDYTITAPP